MTLLDKIKKIFKNPEPPEYILPKDYPAATPDEQKRSPPDGISDESGNRETAGSDSHPGNDAQGIPVDRSGFGDIFDYFFTSESSQKPGPRHGEDLIAYAGITPNAAVTGVDYDLEVTRNEACPSCDGTGSRNRHINTCPTCNGKRQVRKDIQTEHGSFIQVYGCPTCKARGLIPEKPCGKCRGTGHVQVHRFLFVHIPAGVKRGTPVCYEGLGHAGEPGEKNGDLVIRINFC